MISSLSLKSLLGLPLILLLGSSVLAQGVNQPGGGGGINQQNNLGGVTIDGEGVVKTSPPRRLAKAALLRLQQEFTNTQLSPEIIEKSEARTLSLKQLDAAVRQQLQDGKDVSPELRHLAGLQRVDYVLIDRENRDVLLVGPAEGFAPGPDGRLLGLTTGRPPLHLDDLVVALRSRFQNQREMGVSIDPTEANMLRMQQYINSQTAATSTSAAQRRYSVMANLLGNQEISIWGVPTNSHFALIMVEADLRMKRISLGTEAASVSGIRSHLSLLEPQGNSLQRWWFAPFYQPLGTNSERTVFELAGQRVQLLSQEERLQGDGGRSNSAFTRMSTQRFAALFTQHYEALAKQSPVFAELQNLYDLAVVAALVRDEWPFDDPRALPVLLRDERLPLETYPVPRYVPSEANSRSSSRGMLIGLIGGVTIDASTVTGNAQVRELRPPPHAAPLTHDVWWRNAE